MPSFTGHRVAKVATKTIIVKEFLCSFFVLLFLFLKERDDQEGERFPLFLFLGSLYIYMSNSPYSGVIS